jgi:hypothetical protein
LTVASHLTRAFAVGQKGIHAINRLRYEEEFDQLMVRSSTY